LIVDRKPARRITPALRRDANRRALINLDKLKCCFDNNTSSLSGTDVVFVLQGGPREEPEISACARVESEA
jgi:hypothetical protein